jgi:hypothetical protein
MISQYIALIELDRQMIELYATVIGAKKQLGQGIFGLTSIWLVPRLDCDNLLMFHLPKVKGPNV